MKSLLIALLLVAVVILASTLVMNNLGANQEVESQESSVESVPESTVTESNAQDTPQEDAADQSTMDAPAAVTTSIVPSAHYLNRQSLLEQLSLNEDSIVFIGDSLVQRNEWAETFQDINMANRGIDSDTIAGVLNRIDIIAQDQPKQIFILIGANDIYQQAYSQDELIAQYQQIIDAIKAASPDTVITPISVLPVNSTSYNHPINNDLVVAFNEVLAELSQQNDLDYVDAYSGLVDGETNELVAAYTNDGIHLTGEGYAIVNEAVSEYLR